MNAAIILIVSFLVMIFLRIPISFSLLFSSFLTVFYLGLPPMIVLQRMADPLDNISLMAIPFFILAGQIMAESGIAKRLVDFANLLVGRIRGGLAFANIVASMFFGGMSGSSVADTASIGSILIPEMEKHGYEKDYSIAVTVTSSTEGLVIPPSHNAIIYAQAAGGVSIASLFLAGAIPGIMIGLGLMIPAYIIAVKKGYPKGNPPKGKAALKVALDSIWGLMTIVIILGGVLSGIFTATESSVIAVVYALLVATFVYKELTTTKFLKIMRETLATTIAVLFLIGAASAFGWLLAYLNIPELVANTILNISSNKYIILLIINAVLLLLGMIMDMAPLIVITTPIFLPLVVDLGISPIHFGIILMVNLGIGLCTPPVGNTLFVGTVVGKSTIENVFKAMWPFYLAMIGILLLVTYVPFFAEWLPSLISF
ncbi:TRAP transporter large permease [Petrotoga halophila]|uniref:Membrane protein n=1 Tax=Petrotoga halophila DSM 16923 TaxID=1122953 RepID=A0A2S5E9Z8_9BACT|nr:TRAP transporter large permease [Petrotoga halophila]POZ89973.1 membrane protein [Petrotoga halophila DSM 16923]